MEGLEDIMKAGTDRGHIQKGGTRLTLPTEDCYCIIVAGRSALSSLGPLPNKFTNATLNNAGSYGETSPLGGSAGIATQLSPILTTFGEVLMSIRFLSS